MLMQKTLFNYFLWSSSIPPCICSTSFLIHSSADGHLGFNVLSIVNSTAMNIGMHVSFRIILLSRYMPRSGIAGSYSTSVFIFLRNFHSAYHCGCNKFPPTVKEGSLFSNPLQHLLFVNSLIMAIPTDVRWRLTVVLIYISLITGDVEKRPRV